MLLFSWENMDLLTKIYWIIAITSTAIFIILLLLSFFGSDLDANAEISGFDSADVHGGEFDISEGFSGFIISFKSIISFLMMFGWAGILSRSFNLSTILTLFIAFITGLIALFAVSGLLYFISKMTSSGTLKIENAIGKTGEVILRIPPKKQGFGQIQVNIQGGLRTLEAKTEEPEIIHSGESVLVIDILDDNILLVVPKK
jgi:membrane protein implicated in regulation of membrane protease activity